MKEIEEKSTARMGGVLDGSKKDEA